jgi:hypothetical protein
MHLIFPFRVGICFKGRVAKPEASLGQSMESAVPGRKTLHPESLTRFQNTNAQECNVHALRKIIHPPRLPESHTVMPGEETLLSIRYGTVLSSRICHYRFGKKGRKMGWREGCVWFRVGATQQPGPDSVLEGSGVNLRRAMLIGPQLLPCSCMLHLESPARRRITP